ncbi:AraC family transcriptional regulator [Paenibacillus sp. NPDC056579]|uniref:helix-turn-helix transcriptional regulator n=1 Tax=unclassified Paenibacillus TaxID=185978 RepID=UPI001EF8770A|nr:AraC family transcriptional regulator [Paenibacillus sp. H1-7]ULL15948.1 AraC family transcriptional regulator [Paenibacillus sp. H1-7]
MKLIEMVDFIGRGPFILNYKHERIGSVYDMFHSHQGIELLFVHEGTGHIVLDQKIYAISPNTLILFQPYQLHRVYMDPGAGKYIRSVLNLDPVFLDTRLKPFPELRAYFRHLWKEHVIQQIFPQEDRMELTLLYQRFHARLRQAPQETRYEEFVIFIISLLNYLRDTTTSAVSSQIRTDHHTEKVMEWVEAHFKKRFSLDELAAELHLSPYYISHLFKEMTGFSIMDYVIARRLREACLLLGTTDMPVNSICYEIGLDSTSYFSQWFKKHIGISPKAFRNEVDDKFKV